MIYGVDPLEPMTEERMKELLTSYRGDLFNIATFIKTSVRRVRVWVNTRPEVRRWREACLQAAADPATIGRDSAAFSAFLKEYTQDLTVTGLQALEELASMQRMTEIVDGVEIERGLNAAAMKVKADAARTLVSLHPSSQGGQSGPQIPLDDLHKLYVEHAPRIKEIRQITTTVTLEALSEPQGMLIEQDGEETAED